MQKNIFAPILMAGLMLPCLAQAQAVYLNDIEITGTKNQHFADVSVDFDAAGNIRITAPQYKILEQPSKSPAAPSAAQPAQLQPSAVTAPVPVPKDMPALPDTPDPVFVLGLYNSPGLLGFNVEVTVNGKVVKTLDQGKPSQTCEITQYLIKGAKNIVQYRMVMAADSGTSSKATVNLSLAKATKSNGSTVELTGEYAPIEIKGIDGAKTYSVEFMVP